MKDGRDGGKSWIRAILGYLTWVVWLGSGALLWVLQVHLHLETGVPGTLITVGYLVGTALLLWIYYTRRRHGP